MRTGRHTSTVFASDLIYLLVRKHCSLFFRDEDAVTVGETLRDLNKERGVASRALLVGLHFCHFDGRVPATGLEEILVRLADGEAESLGPPPESLSQFLRTSSLLLPCTYRPCRMFSQMTFLRPLALRSYRVSFGYTDASIQTGDVKPNGVTVVSRFVWVHRCFDSIPHPTHPPTHPPPST